MNLLATDLVTKTDRQRTKIGVGDTGSQNALATYQEAQDSQPQHNAYRPSGTAFREHAQENSSNPLISENKDFYNARA